MGYLGATLTLVFTLRRRVTQRCHNSPDGKRGYRVRVTSPTGSARRIWGILKKSVSWVESCLRRRRLTFACSPRPWAGVAWDGRGRWKSPNRKNVHLSPYVEEPLNSKVIKSFVPELRSRKCFSCFEMPMFYVYIYTNIMNVYVPVWICPLHISISGYGIYVIIGTT